MTRDDQRDRILGHRRSDVARAFRTRADVLRQGAVGCRSAPANPPRGLIDLLVERVLVAKVEPDAGKIRLFACEITLRGGDRRADFRTGLSRRRFGRSAQKPPFRRLQRLSRAIGSARRPTRSTRLRRSPPPSRRCNSLSWPDISCGRASHSTQFLRRRSAPPSGSLTAWRNNGLCTAILSSRAVKTGVCDDFAPYVFQKRAKAETRGRIRSRLGKNLRSWRPTMAEAAALWDLLQQAADPAVVASLKTTVESAPDRMLNRINPLAFAKEHGFAEEPVIAALVHSAQLGLFDMAWNMLCRSCSGVLETGDGLRALDRSSYFCSFCALKNEPTLDELVEVTFTVNPRIRRIGAHDPDSLPFAEYMRQIFWSSGLELPEDVESAVQRNDSRRDGARARREGGDVVDPLARLCLRFRPGDPHVGVSRYRRG